MAEKKRSLIFVAITIGVLAAPSAYGQQIPQLTADAARLPQWYRSVVKIFVRCDSDSDGEQELYSGAGTIVRDDGLVLTAAHVGSACMGLTNTVRIGLMTATDRAPADLFEATLRRRLADGNETPTAAQVKSASYQDLALYQIDVSAATDPRPVFPAAAIAPANPLPGEQVAVAGYSDFPFKGMQPTEVAGLSIFTPSLISIATDGNRQAYRLHYTGNTMKGASGGPVFDSRGNLIGVHSARRTNGPSDVLTNYSWGTSVRAIPAGWFRR